MSNNVQDAIKNIKELNHLKSVMEYYGATFKKDSEGYVANCFFHSEKTPSLRLKDKNDGKGAIYHCFGCNAHGDILNFIEHQEKGISLIECIKKAYEILGMKLDIQPSKLDNFISFIKEKNNEWKNGNREVFKYENTYIYYNLDGKPIYLKNKFRNINDKSKKTFITKTIIETEKSFKYGESKDFDETSKVVYNLPTIKKSINQGYWIFFVEGEKDADNLKKIGIPATTIYSKKWFKEYSEQLRGSKVVFIGDTGEAGKQFKDLVVNNLRNICSSLKLVALPGLKELGDNKDVTDWLETGKTKDDLIEATKRSLDILNKYELQQDEFGIYETITKINNETGETTDIKKYWTNFNLIDAEILRNRDNDKQIIRFNITSTLGKKDTIEADARECFTDVKTFRKYLGVDYIFNGKINDLIRFQQWLLNYFIICDTSIYVTTGIREIDGELVLITNKGTLTADGNFNTTIKADNYIHNIDFEGVNVLSIDEAYKLAKHLFNYNSKINVYNTLGLGVAQILNTFARDSSRDNLAVLQDLGESGSGKSIALSILRLLYNNTKKPMSFAGSTDFALLKSFDETFLPIFLDEVKPSKSSKHKVDALSNHIRAITEGYENAKGTKNLELRKFTYNASLIISGEEEIEETAVKNRSNIVWYAKNNFNDIGAAAVDFLVKSEEGQLLLRRFSKSLYLHILNNYSTEYLSLKYDMIKSKYSFINDIGSPREVNTAIYTMLGLDELVETFEELGVDRDKIINFKEAEKLITENILSNVMEAHENGAKAEYEIVLEDIDHLIGIKDYTLQLELGVHYKTVDKEEHLIAFDMKAVFDRLNKYYKTYRDEKLMSQRTFIKMLKRSAYADEDRFYRNIKMKEITIADDGSRHTMAVQKRVYILKKSELKKLNMDNLFRDDIPEFEQISTNVVSFNKI